MLATTLASDTTVVIHEFVNPLNSHFPWLWFTLAFVGLVILGLIAWRVWNQNPIVHPGRDREVYTHVEEHHHAPPSGGTLFDLLNERSLEIENLSIGALRLGGKPVLTAGDGTPPPSLRGKP